MHVWELQGRAMEDIMTDFRHESLEEGDGFVRQSDV